MFKLFFVFILLLGTAGCASNKDPGKIQIAGDIAAEDPYEELNREIFEFNDSVDQTFIRPVATAYKENVPKNFQDNVTSFLRNLSSPINIANQVLQGDFEGATTDVMRALVNTGFGFFGIADVAQSAGLEYEQEDFGQTMAVWGIDHGPYLVLPLIGPSSLRDHTGNMINSFADPVRIYLFNIDEEEWVYARMGASIFEARAQLVEILDDLRENSFDYYAAVRSSYYQRREALVEDKNPNKASIDDLPDIPDYDF